MAKFLFFFSLQVDDDDNEKNVSKIDKNLINMKLDSPAPVACDNIIVGADGIGYLWTFRGNEKLTFNLFTYFYFYFFFILFYYYFYSSIPLFPFFFSVSFVHIFFDN